ncbi:MAG: serine/threonine protein kinase [Candidatus Nanopelagicales bacterium]|nr:serine/threonine protein kinase [Candidatus Nanopelagicales bacterium]
MARAYNYDVLHVTPGTTIGDSYTVISHVGTGSVGSIYLALDEKKSRKVVIKMPTKRFIQMPILSATGSMYPAANFIRHESQMLLGLRNRHVVEMLDQGIHNGLPFTILEFIDASSIEAQIENPMSQFQAIKIISEVLDGLTYLHNQGIIHRDINPKNLLYHPRSCLKIIDFGLAVRETYNHGNLIVRAMGSHRYSAPEQMQETSTRVDLFAVAATLERMIFGPDLRIGAHIGADKKFPAAFLRLLRQAMSETPTDRPASALEFKTALAPFC